MKTKFQYSLGFARSLDTRTEQQVAVKRTVVSVESLRVTPRRTNEQIRRAIRDGKFAELNPSQAGF
jgi:hypothetical protein